RRIVLPGLRRRRRRANLSRQVGPLSGLSPAVAALHPRRHIMRRPFQSGPARERTLAIRFGPAKPLAIIKSPIDHKTARAMSRGFQPLLLMPPREIIGCGWA